MVITLQLLSSLYNLSGFTRRCLCDTEGPYENGKTWDQFHEWALKTGRVKNKVGKQRLTESDKSRNWISVEWCNPLVQVRPRCYYLNWEFINRWWGWLMTGFPPCPSCAELPADLERLPASVCKPFAAGMYKQAVKIGFGWDTQDGSHRKTTHPISTAAWRGRSRYFGGGVGWLLSSHKWRGTCRFRVQARGQAVDLRRSVGVFKTENGLWAPKRCNPPHK